MWGTKVKPIHALSLEHQPSLYPWLVFYWEAFFILSNSRQIDGLGGVRSIPLSELAAYLKIFGTDYLLGIDDYGMRHGFVRAMQEMDRVFIAHYQKESEHARTATKRRTMRR